VKRANPGTLIMSPPYQSDELWCDESATTPLGQLSAFTLSPFDTLPVLGNVHNLCGVEIMGGILFFERNLGGVYFFRPRFRGAHLFRASLVLFRVTCTYSVKSVYFFRARGGYTFLEHRQCDFNTHPKHNANILHHLNCFFTFLKTINEMQMSASCFEQFNAVF